VTRKQLQCTYYYDYMKTSLSLTLAIVLVVSGTSVLAQNPPLVTCPASSTVLCGSVPTVTAEILEPDGQALTVVWAVNGINIQTNQLPATNPTNVQAVSFTAELPFGTNQISITAVDTDRNSASCRSSVVVQDVIPPVITNVSANPTVLWPPNHKLKQITVLAEITDDCTATNWKIISVSSNESETGKGSGNTPSDWKIDGDHKVKLRAERAGKGSGRIYTIIVQASDEAGNLSDPKTITVTVPHDQGKGNDNANAGNGNAGNGKGNGKGKGKGK
jgi:hypothetical protein